MDSHEHRTSKPDLCTLDIDAVLRATAAVQQQQHQHHNKHQENRKQQYQDQHGSPKEKAHYSQKNKQGNPQSHHYSDGHISSKYEQDYIKARNTSDLKGKYYYYTYFYLVTNPI